MWSIASGQPVRADYGIYTGPCSGSWTFLCNDRFPADKDGSPCCDPQIARQVKHFMLGAARGGGRAGQARRAHKAFTTRLFPRGRFVRIHRSIIVDQEKVTQVRSNVVTHGDLSLPIGDSYSMVVMARLRHAEL